LGGGILLLFFIDFLYTTAVAFGTSWFFTSRYLASRTPSQLGKGDVKTLRSMRDELQMLLMLDEQGMFIMPEKNRDRIRVLVSEHDNRKEIPA
jgi:hypothetical protein